MTAEDYLAWERASPTKHEYFSGEVVAFAGASIDHAQIVLNIASLLHIQGRGQGCRTLTNDIRVRVGAVKAYTYPDILIVCGEMQFADEQKDTLLNPTVIIEVLSPSTTMIDRVQKLDLYTSLPSLQEYLLVAQHKPQIDQYVREADGSWRYKQYRVLDAELVLPSVGCAFSVSKVYENVTLTTEDSAPPSPPE